MVEILAILTVAGRTKNGRFVDCSGTSKESSTARVQQTVGSGIRNRDRSQDEGDNPPL